MDYTDRVNSKKGAGAIADRQEANLHTKQRIKSLLMTLVIDLEKDPYLFRNHLGNLECRLCLTQHTTESSYLSHLSGRRHLTNLERRRTYSERVNKGEQSQNFTTMTNIPRRYWKAIGNPIYKITKIRHPESLRMGFLLQVNYQRMTVLEPFFCFMSYYELSQKTRERCVEYLQKEKEDHEDEDVVDPLRWQYLVLSAEPYNNITFAFPAHLKLETTSDDKKTESLWWYWDRDSGEYFLQVLFKAWI
ncbi:hypothetical protein METBISCDRAFT_21667 [Metschnikowia bicuspidata]|uniref:U1-type domain-containing protein n=1 Tax=Metschnikowia bicuspidata TaxID=27322 RepID=A0A4P9ZGP3_9ASCO|nr:hypothetical protein METBISCDRAFT_21667 [Metschnikowia bicuspidata]